MRTVLTIILPLIAPSLVFFIWAWFAKRRAKAEARHQPVPEWQKWPWARLMLAGAILTALTLSAVAMMRDNPLGSRYVPPRLENGELIPGHFMEKPAPGEEGATSDTYHGLGTAPPTLPNQSGDTQ